jgi:hypothetical protein
MAHIAEKAFNLEGHMFFKFTAGDVFKAVSSLVALADSSSFQQQLKELGHLNLAISTWSSPHVSCLQYCLGLFVLAWL